MVLATCAKNRVCLLVLWSELSHSPDPRHLVPLGEVSMTRLALLNTDYVWIQIIVPRVWAVDGAVSS